jgi:hypothetical protein
MSIAYQLELVILMIELIKAGARELQPILIIMIKLIKAGPRAAAY